MSNLESGNAGAEGEGLGWWLGILGVIVVVIPVRLGHHTLQYAPLFTNGVLERLTTPGTDAYQPDLGHLLLAEFLGNGLFFFFSLLLAIFYFKRKKRFPDWLAWGSVAYWLFSFATELGATAIDPGDRILWTDFAVGLGPPLLGLAIWRKYLSPSLRIKAAFAN